MVVLVHEILHRLPTPKQVGVLFADVLQCRALKYHVPLIAQRRCIALLAVAHVSSRAIALPHDHWQQAAAEPEAQVHLHPAL